MKKLIAVLLSLVMVFTAAAAMADLTFAVSTNFRAERPTVTNVAQVSYMEAPSGDTLYSESRLLRDGKHICFYEIRVWDSTGKNIAVVSMNGFHV